jgi:hypothetical protein
MSPSIARNTEHSLVHKIERCRRRHRFNDELVVVRVHNWSKHRRGLVSDCCSIKHIIIIIINIINIINNTIINYRVDA